MDNKMQATIVYWGYIEIMETNIEKMETTIQGLGFGGGSGKGFPTCENLPTVLYSEPSIAGEHKLFVLVIALLAIVPVFRRNPRPLLLSQGHEAIIIGMYKKKLCSSQCYDNLSTLTATLYGSFPK